MKLYANFPSEHEDNDFDSEGCGVHLMRRVKAFVGRLSCTHFWQEHT